MAPLAAVLAVLSLAAEARGQQGSTQAAPADWNPLAPPAHEITRRLAARGIAIDLELGFYDQHASQTLTGHENHATIVWESDGGWTPSRSAWGTGSLHWTFQGAFGLGYDTRDETLADNMGAIHAVNSNLVPNRSALSQAYWQQLSPGGELSLRGGQLDLSSFFDENRGANDAYSQFFASGLENNQSIPWPTYGGLGGIVRYEPREDLYVMVGGADSASANAWGFWKSLRDDSWYQLAEVGAVLQLPFLGTGHYRLIPWHNHFLSEDGWGFAASFDQELVRPDVVAFLRYGIGDDEVTPVEAFRSGGLVFSGPFGRESDRLGVGVAWSAPSDFLNPGQRETLFELYYSIQLSPSISLTPDLQVIVHPSFNPKDDTVVVGGVRLYVRL